MDDGEVGDDVGPGGLEAAYAATVLEVACSDGWTWLVEPRPAGTTDGAFPEGVDHIHVVTAWNPRSELLPRPENQQRNRSLEADLAAAGTRYVPAVGRAPDGSWSEDSLATLDADDVEVVVALARSYAQNAIFEWTPEHLAVLWVDDPRHRSSPGGWGVEVTSRRRGGR